MGVTSSHPRHPGLQGADECASFVGGLRGDAGLRAPNLCSLALRELHLILAELHLILGAVSGLCI